MMLRFRRKNDEIITTHELGNYILEKGMVPTPIYSKSKEYSYIVQPRGSIFARIRRRKKIKA